MHQTPRETQETTLQPLTQGPAEGIAARAIIQFPADAFRTWPPSSRRGTTGEKLPYRTDFRPKRYNV
ncbi:hypothetical protein DPMN_013610 [Dreissena polymorpha]|uniref:Uncharacterized protein n=1 Tax=Dreissena polymorpha TaxID=45954 RepID=A0A9D4N7P7_DREPO|nr:hypothetical protein DPMN_013610 [Dreissena polymorpha]